MTRKLLTAASIILLLSTAAWAAESKKPTDLAAVTNFFASHGLKLEGAITRFAGDKAPDDGFETIEMIRVVNSDWKTKEEKYSFWLWRHRTLAATKKRLELGEMMKWPMSAAGTIVLHWDSGSQKQQVFNLFEAFKKELAKPGEKQDRPPS